MNIQLQAKEAIIIIMDKLVFMLEPKNNKIIIPVRAKVELAILSLFLINTK